MRTLSIVLLLIINLSLDAQISMVKDIYLGKTDSEIRNFRVLGTDLFFIAENAVNTHIYRSDGSEEGTVVVRNAKDSAQHPIYKFETSPSLNKVFYPKEDKGVTKVFAMDGDGSSEEMLFGASVFSSHFNQLEDFKGRAYLTAYGWEGHAQYAILKTDGTKSNTNLIYTSSTCVFDEIQMVSLDNYLIFMPKDNSSFTLKDCFSYDGFGNNVIANFDDAGTKRVIQQLKKIDGNIALIHIYNITDSKHELWKTDGSALGTSILKLSDYPFDIEFAVGYKDRVFFAAEDAFNGKEIWRTNLTSAGTALFADIRAGTPSSNPSHFIIFNDKLFFRSLSDDEGFEMWCTDATITNTALFKDINPGTGDGMMAVMPVVYKDRMYFWSDHLDFGPEIWVSKGSPSNTELVENYHPDGEVLKPFDEDLIVAGEILYFPHLRKSTGVELHKYELEKISSVNEFNFNYELNYYPNPTNGYLNINWTGAFNQLFIIDVTGKLIAQESIANSNQIEMDLNHLIAGTYFIRLANSEGSISAQLIKID